MTSASEVSKFAHWWPNLSPIVIKSDVLFHIRTKCYKANSTKTGNAVSSHMSYCCAVSNRLSLRINQQNDGKDNLDHETMRGGVCSAILQHVWAALWFLQQPTLHDKPKDLFIGKTLIGLFCQSGNLPQHNSK